MKFLNKNTGEYIFINPLELRLSKLRKALSVFANWKDCVAEMVCDVDTIMVTLTYREIDAHRSRHVTEFLRKCKRCFGKKLQGYFWVAEMQKRGAVHYHVIFVVEKGSRLPKPDEAGFWEHGMTRIEKVNHIYSYLSKYLSKDEQKVVYPDGIRIYGSSVYVLKDWIKIKKYPQWLQSEIIKMACDSQDEKERELILSLDLLFKVKGGYKNVGRFIPSPYRWVVKLL